MHSAVCQQNCFIPCLSPGRTQAQLSSSAITFQSVTDKLTTTYYCQHCGYAKVLKALSCSIKGRINLLIYFTAFWTLGCLFHVNEIQSLCNSRGFSSLTIPQQRLGMETRSHKYGLEPCCQGQLAFSEQKKATGKRIEMVFCFIFDCLLNRRDFCPFILITLILGL